MPNSRSKGLPVTLRTEELVAAIIRRALPDTSEYVIEGSSDEECPHPVYISVMVPEDGAEPQLATGPIYNVPVDIIRMAHYRAETHTERKTAVGALHGLFQTQPAHWMRGRLVPGLFLKGWFIQSVGSDNVDDYEGDGMRLVCAVVEA